MNKLKSMLLSFVKPLVLAHISKLDSLSPLLAKKMVEKSHMTQEQADSLAKDLLEVIETEVVVLVNKI